MINAHPSVTGRTVEAVQQAMRELSFRPSRRPRVVRRSITPPKPGRIAFLMIGASNASPTPSFQRLLYGVSKGADDLSLNLTFSYVDDVASAPAKLLEQPLDGLLLHGLEPAGNVAARLSKVPTVWLMGNRTRPTWGDQVMPDNTAIGTLAARYLLRHGHRRLAYLGLGGWSWSFGIRALAFAHTCRDLGGDVHELIASPLSIRDYWGGDLLRAADELVDQFLALPQRPTGIFVSEDRLLPVVQAALIERGVTVLDSTSAAEAGRHDGHAVEIISCNNDARYLPLRGPLPPSIDIASEAIGRRGIEHLLWRIANRDRPERLRIMIAPTLVEADSPNRA